MRCFIRSEWIFSRSDPVDQTNAHHRKAQETQKLWVLTGATIVIIAHHCTAFSQKVPPWSGWIRTAKGRDKAAWQGKNAWGFLITHQKDAAWSWEAAFVISLQNPGQLGWCDIKMDWGAKWKQILLMIFQICDNKSWGFIYISIRKFRSSRICHRSNNQKWPYWWSHTLPVALKLKQTQTGNKILTLTAIKLKLWQFRIW